MQGVREKSKSNEGEKNGRELMSPKYKNVCLYVLDLTSMLYNKLYNRWYVEGCLCTYVHAQNTCVFNCCI